MSDNWSQAGQRRAGHYHSPDPICYNCGLQGHFVVACPEPTRTVPAGLAAARAAEAIQLHPNGNNRGRGGPAQQPSWSNGQRSGAIVTRYPVPKNAPVITRYPVPTQTPQFNPHGSYGAPPPQAPYQQFSGPFAPNGPYPPPQQYGPSGAQNAYGPQGQQPGGIPSGPPPQSGYSGYQAPPYNQYPQQNGPPLFNGPGYQQPPHPYGPPPPAQYQPPGASNYPSHGGYGEHGQYGGPPPPYQVPQSHWNNTPPAPRLYGGQNHQQPRQPRQNRKPRQQQYDPGYDGEHPTTSSEYQPQAQQPSQQASGYGSESYQQPVYSSSDIYAQNQLEPAQNSPPIPQSFPPNSNHSMPSSRDSTPYAGRRASTSSSTRTGRRRASTSSRDQEREVSRGQNQKKARSGEDQQFNWDFKQIFTKEVDTENVALAQPLSTIFDMTPVPLLNATSTNSVSRYARRENLKEFTQTIRKSPQWSYLQQDPAFSDVKLEGPLIPLRDVPEWTEARHGTSAERTSHPGSRQPPSSRKRARSDEPADLHATTETEDSVELHEGNLGSKRQKNGVVEQEKPADDARNRPGTPTASTSTPTLARAVTPSFGVEDDVWAPQPGEGVESASGKDLTEALLASLGVTGSPKPVGPPQFPPALQPAQAYYNHSRGDPPSRQDSGYVSAPRSYSNGSRPNAFNKRRSSQWDNYPAHDLSGSTDGPSDDPWAAEKSPSDTLNRQNASNLPQSSSPMSPTSADILAKLVGQPRKPSNGKKTEPLRQVDDAARKYKGPQPVVAEAYSRRW